MAAKRPKDEIARSGDITFDKNAIIVVRDVMKVALAALL